MPSHIYMIGLMTTITCVESPEVVETRINDARSDLDHDSEFIELTHMAQIQEAKVPPGSAMPVMGEIHDSYAPLRVRYDHIQAVRAYHEKEEM